LVQIAFYRCALSSYWRTWKFLSNFPCYNIIL